MFLLTLLLIILFLFLVIRLIPLFLAGFVRRKQNQKPKGKEGDVYVSKNDAEQQEKVVEKHMGEYVDYEQVKEEK